MIDYCLKKGYYNLAKAAINYNKQSKNEFAAKEFNDKYLESYESTKGFLNLFLLPNNELKKKDNKKI